MSWFPAYVHKTYVIDKYISLLFHVFVKTDELKISQFYCYSRSNYFIRKVDFSNILPLEIPTYGVND